MYRNTIYSRFYPIIILLFYASNYLLSISYYFFYFYKKLKFTLVAISFYLDYNCLKMTIRVSKCSNCSYATTVGEYLYSKLFPVVGSSLYLLCVDCVHRVPITKKIGSLIVSETTLDKVNLVRDILEAHQQATQLNKCHTLCKGCEEGINFRMTPYVTSSFNGKLGDYSISEICYLCAMRSVNRRK